VKRQVVAEVCRNPGHRAGAELGTRPPAVIHAVVAVDLEALPTQHEFTGDMALHLEVAVHPFRAQARIGRLAGRVLEQGVLFRVVRIEGTMQSAKVQVEAAGAESVLVAQVVVGRRLRGLDAQAVVERVLLERRRAAQVHLRVGEVDLERLTAETLTDDDRRDRNAEIRPGQHVGVAEDAFLGHAERQERGFGPRGVRRIAAVEFGVFSGDHVTSAREGIAASPIATASLRGPSCARTSHAPEVIL
jgi:hypothetical protein